MPMVSYQCDCGKVTDRLEGGMIADEGELVCECGSKNLVRKFAGAYYNVGYGYGDPLEHQMAIKNRQEIEANAEKYLSGEREFKQPKGVPDEYVPRVPDGLKKAYY